MQFTALLHHLTVGLLREGFYALKRKAAPGVEGVTWEEYESGIEGRLVDLHSQVHRGAYRAQPSRRVRQCSCPCRIQWGSPCLLTHQIHSVRENGSSLRRRPPEVLCRPPDISDKEMAT